MKLKASIIIPTVRHGTIKYCVNRINETSKGIPYEIVVVSPYNMEVASFDNVKFIKETNKDGNMAAERLGVQHCEGEYLMPIGDYFLFDKDCLKNLIEFCDKQLDIMLLTSPKIHGFSKVQPECTVFGKYYPRLPFIHRKWLDKIGGLVDEKYKYNHGDVDLAMRVHEAKGIVKPCPGAYAEVFDPTVEDIADNTLPKDDAHIFTKRWLGFASLEDVPYPYNPYELSHELSQRVYTKIRQKAWDTILEEFEQGWTASKRFFPWLLSYILLYWNDIPNTFKVPLLRAMLDVAHKEHHWLYYSLCNNMFARELPDIDGNSRILSMIVASMLIFRVNEILGRGHFMIENFYDRTVRSWESLLQNIIETSHRQVIWRIKTYKEEITSISNISKLAEFNWEIDNKVFRDKL